MISRKTTILVLTVIAVIAAAVLVACSGGNGNTSTAPGIVNTTLSDPATCSASASGPYNNVWVTVTDVQINASSSAGDNDPNWIDLTPNLKGAPQQVDLLSQAATSCFLATLGSNVLLQPGTYQQIRIMLAPNNTSVSGNHCGSAGANCIVLAASPNSPQPLLLSSEATTGIKIPSGQIAGGQFTIGSGQTKDLNIDFNTCASIVVQGTGQFRLKPVLTAGEVSTVAFISGKLIDGSTKQAINGGKAIVALEQKDTNGVDRVIMQATPDSTGAFNFCPVPVGTYDVVAVAVNGAGAAYAATITTGVPAGTTMGNIPLTPIAPVPTAVGSITGTVTSANGSAQGVAANIQLSALQTVSATVYTIPAGNQSATLTVQTAKPSGCAADPCPPYTAAYTMAMVPPIAPAIGAFSVTPPTSYTGGTGAPPASYVVEGQAFMLSPSTQSFCSPSLKTTAAVSVNAGSPAASAPQLDFTGCQ
ncbi:MAG: DUF4382 domain-containing protein [Terriglobales bacterium]